MLTYKTGTPIFKDSEQKLAGSDMQSERARKSVVFDSLVEPKRVAKRCITQWTQDLIAQISDIHRADDRFLVMSGVQNNLALILLHRDGPTAARASCSQHILWALKLRRADLAIQPILNLIRLSRAQGEFADARKLLGNLRTSLDDSRVHFDEAIEVKIGAETLDFIRLAYVMETFKMCLEEGKESLHKLLVNRDYNELARAQQIYMAEQYIRAALIFGWDDIYLKGDAHFATLRHPYFKLLRSFYHSLWQFFENGNHQAFSLVIASTIDLAQAVSDAHVGIDHRFCRYLLSAAKFAALVENKRSAELYEHLDNAAERLGDIQLTCAAKLGLGVSQKEIGKRAAAHGYRQLPGVEIPAFQTVDTDQNSRKIEMIEHMLQGLMSPPGIAL